MVDLEKLLKKYKVLSIVGMCKNAGKTTMLNCIIGLYAKSGLRVALTSIGRDGEKKDIVTDTEKPGIYVKEGSIIATGEKLLRLCDITKEIIATTQMTTPLGNVTLVKALSDGNVQIAGPSMTEQLKELNNLFKSFEVDNIIIDGAIGRKSLGSRSVAEGLVLCTGASYHRNFQKVIDDTVFTYRLMKLPKAATIPLQGEFEQMLKEHGEAFITGALLDSTIEPMLLSGNMKGKRIVVRDPSSILLTSHMVEKMDRQQVRLEVISAADVAVVAINPVSAYGIVFDKDEFKERLAERIDVPVINVKELA